MIPVLSIAVAARQTYGPNHLRPGSRVSFAVASFEIVYRTVLADWLPAVSQDGLDRAPLPFQPASIMRLRPAAAACESARHVQ